jgi:hypothetical protein
MPIILNNSNIEIQYNTGSSYVIETVKSDLYFRDVYFPRESSRNSATWTDNGYTVTAKVSDAVFNSDHYVYYLFNHIIIGLHTPYLSLLSYNGTGNTYTGATRFKTFAGIAISVDFGRSIYPKRMRIAPRPADIYGTADTFLNGAPKAFKIFASDNASCWNDNNHSSWSQIHDQTTGLTYTNEQYTIVNFTANLPKYRYYTMVVLSTIGNYSGGYLTISEWNIGGDEKIDVPQGAQWTYSSNNPNVYHLGNVGIGTTSPEYNLDVRGNIYTSIGGYTGSTLTTWSITSDRRIKENIVKASYEKCLENVNKIELYNFNFKDNCVNTNDKHQLGFIAQEVREVYPKAVEVNKMILNTNETIDDILTLNTTQIDYTLYGAVKNLIDKIDNIDIELENLGSNITYNKDLIRNTSNIFSIITSNISITTSNIFIGTSNISITTSNISIITSNIFIGTSNIPTETSNIPTETSNIPIYTSYIPFDTSNISIN